MGGERKRVEEESRCVFYVLLLPEMDVNFMYCKHVLIR